MTPTGWDVAAETGDRVGEGPVWIAAESALHWVDSRFGPDGRLDRAIALPVANITSCAFAREKLDRLFVTSARDGCEGQRLAGALFEVSPGAAGLPPGSFDG